MDPGRLTMTRAHGRKFPSRAVCFHGTLCAWAPAMSRSLSWIAASLMAACGGQTGYRGSPEGSSGSMGQSTGAMSGETAGTTAGSGGSGSSVGSGSAAASGDGAFGAACLSIGGLWCPPDCLPPDQGPCVDEAGTADVAPSATTDVAALP